MGIPDGEMKAQLDGDTKDGGDDAEPVFNPFTQPFILLTLIFIRPLRQRLLKSVPKFCRERISVIQPPPNAVKGKAVTALRQKSKAEDGESLAGLVDEILDGQKDAAAEAE